MESISSIIKCKITPYVIICILCILYQSQSGVVLGAVQTSHKTSTLPFAHIVFPLINETFIKQALNTKKSQAISFNLYTENHVPQI